MRVMATILFLSATAIVLGAPSAGVDLTTPSLEVGPNCQKYAETHTLVLDGVLAEMLANTQNLRSCETSLSKAQEDLTGAHARMSQAERDLKALSAAAQEQRAVIAELRAQKKVLEDHITRLEDMTCPEPGISDHLVTGWEEVDGPVGVGVGYALGTAMCIGIAYVFNQPSFTR